MLNCTNLILSCEIRLNYYSILVIVLSISAILSQFNLAYKYLFLSSFCSFIYTLCNFQISQVYRSCSDHLLIMMDIVMSDMKIFANELENLKVWGFDADEDESKLSEVSTISL